MDVLVMAGQLILSLSILVVLHEFGHFLPARLFGTRVEKFYLFFDPYFALFKKKIGETEYGIGWLPLGGYVKISGMIDESMDLEQMKEPAQPWEFRSKKAWQRLIIMLGGVTVNFFLGIFIFTMMLWYWGEQYLPIENAKYGIVTDSLGKELGLMDGDKVLKVGDLVMTEVSSVPFKNQVIFEGARSYEVERNGSQKTVSITDEQASSLTQFENTKMSLFTARFPFVASEDFPDDSPAKEAGIRSGDRIFELNGKSTPYFQDFFNTLMADRPKAPKRGGIISRLFGKKEPAPDLRKTVNVKVERKNKQTNALDTIPFKITTTEQGFIGVAPVPLETATRTYSFAEAIPAGYDKGVGFLGSQIKAFKQMFTGQIKAKDSLGSFLTIGKAFGGTWDWKRFWSLTAALSMILAFMNLLPIPALDGGHVMFLLYEVITGRKPSDKVLEYSTMAGFILLMALMVYVIGLDIWRHVL